MKRTWSALIGIPIWVFVVNLLNMRWYNNDWLTYVWTSFLIILYIFLFWRVGLWWVRQVQTWLPTLQQTRQRVLLTFGGYLLGVLSIQAAFLFLISHWKLLAVSNMPSLYVWQALIGAMAVVITGSIYEFSYYFGLYTKAVDEAKAANKALYNSELNALKQQVNPHFLFNSLNILDSLIDDDPQQARVFLDDLSSVYRYLLRFNEQNLTDLTDELGFIQSYYQLLKTRHGSGLNMVVAVDERLGHYQIPPLTLQLLVENAVKHNIVLPDQPLTIEIKADGEAQLSVSNTLQKKPTRVLSNGVGLSNIMAKYQMLGQPMPTVQEMQGQFVVTLPLITKDN